MQTATILDARGIPCPKPVILAEKALADISEGTLEVLVDNEASVGNLTRYATKNGFYAESVADNSHWRVRIVKGYICDTPAAETTPVLAKKELLLVIASDTMGKDEVLGRILMKGCLETIKVTGELPHTIFFLNTGVRLTTVDDEFITLLRELAERGVEIFSCGTCLKHFNLESSLKVGYRGTTNHIVEGMKDFAKTVWIS